MGVYDSLARGIESGFSMGLRADEAAEQKRRNQVIESRADDEMSLRRQRETREETRAARAERTSAADRAMQALAARRGEIEGLSVAARTANQAVDPALAAEYGDIEGQLAGMRQQAMDDWSRVQAGQEDPLSWSPAKLYSHTAVALGRKPEELPEVSKAIKDVEAGLQTGNQGLVVQGANQLLAPLLKRGVGSPSPYGGTITRKEIIGLDPARGGDGRDHPDKVIPRLRVYVSGVDPSNQELFYDAPMSKDGGTDDAPVAIDLTKAMDWMGNLGVLAQAVQRPEVAASMAEGSKAAGPRVQAYLDRLTQLGDAKKPKPQTVTTAAGAKTSVLNPDGSVKVTIEGNSKPPITKEVIDGDQKYTAQWDETAGKWVPIGAPGPRFNPRIGAGTGPGGSIEATLSPETRRAMAEQYRAGDKSVLTNLGRGAQGAANIVALREEIAKQMRERGETGRDVALAMKEFDGMGAAQRSLGTRAANFGLAKSEAYEMADLVTESSGAVSRTQFMPINKALVAFEKNTGDVAVRQFGAAINSFINAYARAISPVGVPTVSDKDHARDMLSTADSHAQVVGIITQLKKEMEAAGNAPGVVKEQLRSGFRANEAGGAGGTGLTPGKTPGIKSAPQPTPADIEWAKQSPTNKANFLKAFGREP